MSKKLAASSAAALTVCIQTVTLPYLASSASRLCRHTNNHCAEQRNTFPLQQTTITLMFCIINNINADAT